MKNVEGKEWGILTEKVRKLSFELSTASEQFERTRVENISKRYQLLKEALKTGYASDQTLQYIAELGAEFANKTYEYCGGSPFRV